MACLVRYDQSLYQRQHGLCPHQGGGNIIRLINLPAAWCRCFWQMYGISPQSCFSVKGRPFGHIINHICDGNDYAPAIRLWFSQKIASSKSWASSSIVTNFIALKSVRPSRSGMTDCLASARTSSSKWLGKSRISAIASAEKLGFSLSPILSYDLGRFCSNSHAPALILLRQNHWRQYPYLPVWSDQYGRHYDLHFQHKAFAQIANYPHRKYGVSYRRANDSGIISGFSSG